MGIEVKNLTKTYKVKKHSNVDEVARDFGTRNYTLITAVNNISFTIPSGDIVGFIGANGAGKSTTIKMMTGILTPDYGTISIDGLNFKKNRKQIMLRIGVVFGQRSVLCWDIPVIESFKLFKDMFQKKPTGKYGDIFGYSESVRIYRQTAQTSKSWTKNESGFGCGIIA